jgi:glutaredoxin
MPSAMNSRTATKTGAGNEATLYRMVTPEHICPFGLKAKDLLNRKGYKIDDHHLQDRDQTDAFKKKFNVETTPQVFINGERIGGYDALRKHFGMTVKNKDELTYTPVLVVFIMTALMAVAASWAPLNRLLIVQAGEWFIAFSMCVLAILKLRDIESFSNMFLGYDVLARRIVRYAYVYPVAEAVAGILMIAGGILAMIAVPIMLFIGSVGAWSVFKAVYIEKRNLKCACVGGDSNVPLGFVSLTENLMMVAMGIWMLAR